MRAGIALDSWKLPTFEERLKQAGFSYRNSGNVAPGILFITIETEDLDRLKTVITQCEEDCRKFRQAKPRPRGKAN